MEQAAVHTSPYRMRLVAGGERGGKSYSAAMELFGDAMRGPGLWWIVGPDYLQCRAEFGYVSDAMHKAGLVASESYPQQGQCTLTTRVGGQVETKTADDVKKLAGKAPDGVLMCEAAQQPYDAWLKLRGRVAERRGWLWASGTFEGSAGWYAQMWLRWQADNPEGGRSFSLPTWSNLAVFPGGREDPEIKALEATYPPDLFMERFGAVPCPPATLVFREFDYAQHVSDEAEYDDTLPVHLAIDPGYAGAYAVLAVQRDGPDCWVIDEVYRSGAVAEEIISECEKRAWWSSVRGGVIDVAGRAHAGLPSHVEVWQQRAGLALVSNRVGIVDGILRLRTFLRDPATGAPRITFNPKCKSTFSEFGAYKYPDVKENRPVAEEPIDRDNHALKALGYWLYAVYGPVDRGERKLSDAGYDRLASVSDPQPAEAVELVRVESGGLRFQPRRMGRASRRADLLRIRH